MTAKEKIRYNHENELDYHFAPFTPQRAELRKKWATTRKDWNSFLYDQEKKYQQSKK